MSLYSGLVSNTILSYARSDLIEDVDGVVDPIDVADAEDIPL